MRRRSVLGSVGVFLVAGCTGSSGGGSGTTTTTTTETESTTTEAGPTTTETETTTTSSAPSVGSSSLRVTSAGCGSRDAGGATVSFAESSVTVTGTVVGNNGCYRARLGAVSYEASSDTCRLMVEAFNASPGKLCTQCITTIDYDARVTFEDGLPGAVEVVHDDMGGRSTVATASR